MSKNEHWDVWLEWYRDRLDGVARSEAYELVFAIVPLEVWEKGPAAANAWIAEHLPKNAPTLNADEFPNPIPDLPAPFTYSWPPYQHIAIVAGLQNLPFFSHFKSEEEHRQVLEACRIGAERLLKMPRESHFHNVRPLYASALRNYLDDLPRTAGQGSILVAHEEALHLRKMFLADVDVLPAGFASRLERVISNQFALNGFYDLVQRHNEAVASAKWTQAFPTDAAKQFFGVVEANTPKFFEPEVAKKVQRIEATAEAEPAAQAPSARSSARQPPPLPAGSPGPKRSAEHQVASSANALYEVFFKGKDLPLAVEGRSRVAHELGDAIGPILTFLKGL